MSLTRSLERLHRQLTDLWSDTSDRPCELTHSEYGYLRAIERLDGEQLARAAGEFVPEVVQAGKLDVSARGKLSVPKDNDAEGNDLHSSDPKPGDMGHHLQDLVALLKVRKASASVAIAKLEKRGLICRFACQYDARAQHIVLTDKGKENLRAEEVIYEAATSRIKNILTPEELSVLESCLSKIDKAF
ncbi:MAG: MarR family winged helix-turn-helix transcriptional regulator [Halopseudomonas aestusnigri]